MKALYPQYAERVTVLAIGVDPTESADLLKRHAETMGYPWRIATGPPELLQTFKVTSTDVKYVVDARGVIAQQGGYGVLDEATWQQIFARLVQS